jgi:hypothetical protein
MKKTILLASITLLTSSIAFAQTRTRYVFDNFDTSRGVQVVGSSVTPKTKTGEPAEKKLVQKTVQSKRTMDVSDGLGFKSSGGNLDKKGNKVLMSDGSSMGGFTTGNLEVDRYIVDACKLHGVDPLLIYSQMHQESAFKRNATSNKGASGYMQLMPATAIRFGVTSIYDPQQNIFAGVKYMRWLLDKFDGDIRLALAGYNAGEGAVMKYGNQIPPYNETQEYVRRITARYNSIRNPYALKTVKVVSKTEVAKIEKQESKPLTVIERNAVAVKLPDGRMRLVNQ